MRMSPRAGVLFLLVGCLACLLIGCQNGSSGLSLHAYTRPGLSDKQRSQDLFASTSSVGATASSVGFDLSPSAVSSIGSSDSGVSNSDLGALDSSLTTCATPLATRASATTRGPIDPVSAPVVRAAMTKMVLALLHRKATRSTSAIDYTDSATGIVWTGSETEPDSTTSFPISMSYTAHGTGGTYQANITIKMNMTLSGSLTAVNIKGDYSTTIAATVPMSSTTTSVPIHFSETATVSGTIHQNGSTGTSDLTAHVKDSASVNNKDVMSSDLTMTLKMTVTGSSAATITIALSGNATMSAADGYWVTTTLDKLSMTATYNSSTGQGAVSPLSGSIDWKTSDGTTAHLDASGGWVKNAAGTQIATITIDAQGEPTVTYLADNSTQTISLPM